MEGSRITRQEKKWELKGYKRKVRTAKKKNRWTSSNEIWRTWTLAGKKPKNWQKTEQNGVNVWPEASTRMRAELRSKVKCNVYLSRALFCCLRSFSRSTFSSGLISSSSVLQVKVSRSQSLNGQDISSHQSSTFCICRHWWCGIAVTRFIW